MSFPYIEERIDTIWRLEPGIGGNYAIQKFESGRWVNKGIAYSEADGRRKIEDLSRKTIYI